MLSHVDTIIFLTNSQEGKYLFSTSKDLTLKVWDLENNSLLMTYKDEKSLIIFAYFTKYNKDIVYCTVDDKII